MLMRPNKAEAAVHGCHCPGDMAVRMRKVLARLWVGVRVCHLLLLLPRSLARLRCTVVHWEQVTEIIPRETKLEIPKWHYCAGRMV